MQEVIDGMGKMKAEYEGRLSGLEAELAEAGAERQAAHDALAAAEDTVAELRSVADGLEAKLESVQRDRQGLADKVDRNEESIDKLVKTKATLTKSWENRERVLKTEVETLRSASGQKEHELGSTAEQVEALHAVIRTKDDAHERAVAELQEAEQVAVDKLMDLSGVLEECVDGEGGAGRCAALLLLLLLPLTHPALSLSLSQVRAEHQGPLRGPQRPAREPAAAQLAAARDPRGRRGPRGRAGRRRAAGRRGAGPAGPARRGAAGRVQGRDGVRGRGAGRDAAAAATSKCPCCSCSYSSPCATT
jgi:hypothetical protein